MAAVAELALDAGRFLAGIAMAQNAVKQFQEQAANSEGPSRFAQATVAIGAALTGAAVASAAAIKGVIDMGANLQAASLSTGLTVAQLMQMQEAFRMVGGSSDGLVDATKKMNAVLSDAAKNTPAATKALSDAGVTLQSLQNLNTGQRLETIARAVGQIKTPADQAASALALMGENGQRMVFAMNPTTMSGAAQALGKQADMMQAAAGMFARIALVLGASGSTLADIANAAKLKLQGLFTGIAAGIAPEILSIIDAPKKGLLDVIRGFEKIHPALTPAVKIVEDLLQLDLASVGLRIGAAFGVLAELVKSGEFGTALKSAALGFAKELSDKIVAIAYGLQSALSVAVKAIDLNSFFAAFRDAFVGVGKIFVGQIQQGIASVLASLRANSFISRQMVSDEEVSQLNRTGLLTEQAGRAQVGKGQIEFNNTVFVKSMDDIKALFSEIGTAYKTAKEGPIGPQLPNQDFANLQTLIDSAIGRYNTLLNQTVKNNPTATGLGAGNLQSPEPEAAKFNKLPNVFSSFARIGASTRENGVDMFDLGKIARDQLVAQRQANERIAQTNLLLKMISDKRGGVFPN